jgi:hypothetical protein
MREVIILLVGGGLAVFVGLSLSMGTIEGFYHFDYPFNSKPFSVCTKPKTMLGKYNLFYTTGVVLGCTLGADAK